MKPLKGAKAAEKTSTIKVGRDSGRVRVFVRVRPPRPQENSRNEPTAVSTFELSSQIHISDPKYSWEKTFSFDHVFPQESTNPEICNTISRPLVNAALNGFNGTLMAYGQTGSGKTHTLMAPDGITAGVIERCFKRISQDDYHDYKVTMSYLQIYQEKIYDLLNSTNKVELSLREHPTKGVYVENLSEYVVRSPTEVLSLLAVGKKRLIFAETKMNRTSSRSHSVCQLRIERTLNKSKVQGEGSGKDGVTKQGAANARDSKEGRTACTKKSQVVSAKDTSEVTDVGEDDVPLATKMVAFDDDVLIRGRIYLCDLAGSERLKKTHAEGERLSEAQHINSSLLELGNVIQALAEGKKTHVPFRNSTLTRLLQESLGGNCKTSLVVCVSPTASDVSETKCALFFGSRAMKITNTAYVNVEVDYQRLSEDLSKIVDMKERDLIELKQSYETRIERMRNEAETTVTNAVTEAEKVIASVKNLYENQQTDLQNQIQNLQTRLEEEKSRAETQRHEIMEVRCKLQRDMYRSKSVLLVDIISMQLLYVMKTLFVKDGASTSYNSGAHYKSTRIKILENTDFLLKLFKSYLRLMNSKGHELLENGVTLRCVTDLKDLYEEPTALCDAKDMSIYLSNKTDDDKVVASSCCHDTPNESRNDCVPCNGEVSDGNKEFWELKEKLVSLKNSIDGEALEFLSKAFELEEEHMNDTLERRENIYIRIMDLIERKKSLSATTANTELSSLADSLSLLDHCHSHVIVDKALQCALLLLENASISKQSRDVWSQKRVVEKENQELKTQVQCLKTEAENLHGKLTETSSKLCDVKKSKEQLEDDLSSVFQLYNMKDNAKLEDRENDSTEYDMDGVNIPQKLQAEISTLVENNVKLKKELAATEKEKENLECQLATTKKEFEREKAKSKEFAISFHCRSTQTEETERAPESTASRDEDLLERLLTVLHDDYSALEKAASAAQTNDIGDLYSLRTVINKRLGEEWSVLVLENAKMKSELENIRSRIVEERESFEGNLTNVEIEEFKEGKTNGIERNNKKEEMGNSSLEFEKSSDVSDTQTLEIKIYDQNRVIAKLEMDKVELVKGLQRFRQDAGSKRQASSKGENESNKAFDVQRAEEFSQEDLSLGNILKEKLQKFVRFQQENQSLQEELSTLRSKYNSLERDYNDSNKSTESLEQKLKKLVEGERQLSLKIVKMADSNENLEEKLVRKSKENRDLKEELQGMGQKVREIEQDMEAIKDEKTVLEGILVEDVRRAERTLALEREKRSALENALQEKTKELEEEKTMIRLSENRLNKAESELNDAKKNSELLQESLKKFEEEQDNMIKEINSLRCLQGLPTVKVKSSATVGPKKQTRAREDQQRQENRQDNKLNCELTRAKEQLLRLKAELTLSNMQTRNLGSQLSSLREDSTKLEVELSTVRVSPTRLRPRRNSFTCYDETVQLEMELGEARGKIIELQEKLLITYKEKFVLEEKLTNFETQTKKETARLTETSKGEEKEIAIKDGGATMECPGDCKTDKLCEIKENPAHEPRQDFDSEQRKMLEKRVNLLEEEKENLKKELEHRNADTCRLEGLESCIQQLVSLEDEKLRLQRRLKQWAHNKTEDKGTTSAAREKPENRKQLRNNISLKKPAKKTFKSDLLAQIEDLSTENCALQEEAEHLKEKVIDLEDALMALEFKMSIEDSARDTASDKKALATVLASVKQERSELQKALQEILSEKNSMEEELEEMKAKYTKVQRELALTSMMKEELEADLLALRNTSLNRSLSSLTQCSDECRSDRSSTSIDDLLFRNGDGCTDESVQKARSISLSPDELAVGGNGRKPGHCNANGKTVTRNTKKDNRASARMNSASGAKQTEKKPPLFKPRNSASSQATTTKASGRRGLPPEPRDKQAGKGFPRSDIVNSQSTTNNTTHWVTSYNLIRIDDDVADVKFNTDSYSTDGGLFYESPKEDRQNPEGMETNMRSLHETTLFDKTAVTVNETDVLEEPYGTEVGFDIEHSGEVVVKTAWSLRNLFNRQKSLSLPDHDVAALRQ